MSRRDDTLMKVKGLPAKLMKMLYIAAFARCFPRDCGDERLEAQSSHNLLQGQVFAGTGGRFHGYCDLRDIGEILALYAPQTEPRLRKSMEQQ